MDERNISKEDEQETMIIENIRGFRNRHDPCGEKFMWIYAEANASFAGDRFKRWVEKMKNIEVLKLPGMDRYGIIKTATMSELYVFQTARLISMDAVRFHTNVGTANHSYTADELIKELKYQMFNTERKNNKIVFKGNGFSGDLKVTFEMCCTWPFYIVSNYKQLYKRTVAKFSGKQ